MPRLIHLNGPPGIGKSTLARMYVDVNPGVLNLDIDQLRGMVGGWLDRFGETGEIVRPIALSMARTHLQGGRDVVMPQYLGKLGEIARFEAVALDSGADFCEVVLMDTKERCVERFGRRGDDDDRPWHRQVQDIVARNGGPALLADMHDRLTDIVHSRPGCTVLQSETDAIAETLNALLDILTLMPPKP